MKINFLYIVFAALFLTTTTALSQEKYTDKEIGFDRKAVEADVLKDEHGDFGHLEGSINDKVEQIRDLYIKHYNSVANESALRADLPPVNPDCINMDFSDTNFNGWCRYTSDFHEIGNIISSEVIGYCDPDEIVEPYENAYHFLDYTDDSRFEVIAKNDFNDFFIGTGTSFPVGVDHVARIGNSLSNGKIEQLRQVFVLSESNSIYKFNYAVVLENPEHGYAYQPRFRFHIEVNGVRIPCSEKTFVAGNVPSFTSVDVPTSNELDDDGMTQMEYLGWQDFSMDLSAYGNIGDEISIVASVNDCAYSAHAAYAYFSAQCGESNLGINITSSSDNFCPGETLTFTNEAIGTFNDETYLWTFHDSTGTTTSTDPSPTYVFDAPGSYTVELEITIEGESCSQQFSREVVVVDYGDCDDDPCDEIALVIDESGSISDEEALQIRSGLYTFIDNSLDTGLNISIIGMSDSDTNTRTDHIGPLKVTAATKPQFDSWIAGYGNRNGNTGISGSSDYWASALSVINDSNDHNPDLVIIFTDGSQTADTDNLKNEIADIRTNSNIYVYGIDNEYYVNGDNTFSRLPRNQDPNYVTLDKKPSSFTANNAASRDVIPSLRTSLEFLFNEPPVPGDNLYLDVDFYGYDDFIGFGTGLTTLSNVLAQSGISCTNTLDECYDCYTFQPEPNKTYWVSAWVKEDLNTQVKTYSNTSVVLSFINAADIEISAESFYPTGNITDGWQRIVGKFTIPENTVTLDLELANSSDNVPVYFDDVRVHPINGNMKSFVYDPVTYRLMAELDENNYSTYYEYDNEGGLVRVKKETSKGIKTIQETRSGSVIKIEN